MSFMFLRRLIILLLPIPICIGQVKISSYTHLSGFLNDPFQSTNGDHDGSERNLCKPSSKRNCSSVSRPLDSKDRKTFVQEFTEEKKGIVLNNGTRILSKERLLVNEGGKVKESSKGNRTSPKGSNVKDEKGNNSITTEDEDEDEDLHGRILGVKLNRVPKNVTMIKHPTLTLAQLARQYIFPNWFWNGAVKRPSKKTGKLDNKPFTSNPNKINSEKIPTITFDNNFSRFLKLFSVVRFPNTPCVTGNGENGTCYHTTECGNLGGTGTGPCAGGFGVCCVFLTRCGESVSRNGSYFVSNGVSSTANGVLTCTIKVDKITPLVKQIRLDFHVFRLLGPSAGTCETDRFVVSGQNTNNVLPILCGENSGSHIYVETDGSTSVQLSIMTTGEGERGWSIQITQFEESPAPIYCLQYYTGVMNSIMSFNYMMDSPQYLNNLNYAICIRKEAGFCSLTFTNTSPDGTYLPFQIVNANENGNLMIPSGQAGVGVLDCPFDFVLINGNRLCGERFNDGLSNIILVEDSPITDISSGPFAVVVRTNEMDVGGGFRLYYRQNPCMSSTAG